MSDDYTPTTEEILRSYTLPRMIVDPQRDDETFGEWLSRASIETFHVQEASERAARRWLAAHDAEVLARGVPEVTDEARREAEMRELHHFETEQAIDRILAVATKTHTQSWLADLAEIASIARAALAPAVSGERTETC